ncbi:MAG: hypothetical protein HY319_02445 [Armatimonadetes bacterium]|nr:hypothetical protein [Armatimonadota bacterium]
MHADPVDAHILIGLGGLGAEAVQQAARWFGRAGQETRKIAFLAVDLDEMEEGPVACFRLRTEELLEAAQRPRDFPAAGEWLPPIPTGEVKPSGGARLRPVGRLAFCLSVRRFEEWLARYLVELTSGGAAARLHFSFISSLGGGTGGAILCDVAYTAHRLLLHADRPMRAAMEALLLTRPKGRGDDLQAANQYAALVELNHSMAPETIYRFHYSSGEIWETDRAPFDQVYLFSSRDLNDRTELDKTLRQLCCHLALSLSDDYAALQKEVKSRQEALFQEGDDYGNPTSYYSEGAAVVVLPFREIRATLAARIAAGVVHRWRTVLFRQEAEPPAGGRLGERFLLQQSLTLRSVVDSLQAALTDQDGVPYRPADRADRVRGELDKHALFGMELAGKLEKLDRQMQEELAEDGPLRVVARTAARAAELLERGKAAVERELTSYFRPGEEDFSSYRILLQDLGEAVSAGIQQVYEQLNLREVDDIRLREEKQRLLDAAAAFEGGVLRRMLRKNLNGPADPCLTLISRCHQNRLDILLHREALNLYLGLLDSVERFATGVHDLLSYLEELETELEREERLYRESIFSVPGEVLLSRPEVDRFLEEQSREDMIRHAAERVFSALGEVYRIQSAGRKQAVTGILGVISEVLGDSERADVLEQFYARYPGEAARDQLRILFERARPSQACELELEGYSPIFQPRAAYAAVHMTEPTELHRRLMEELGEMPSRVPVTILPLMSRERLVFLRLHGGFPLRGVDLVEPHRVYLQELRLGRNPVHSRNDTRWRSLARANPDTARLVYRDLAFGLHLGLLRQAPNTTGAEGVESPRWPDMGSVRRTLENYERLEEALLVENAFLQALRRWIDSRVDEIGAESFIKVLDAPGESLSLLGLDFTPHLEEARKAFVSSLEERWPEWSEAVARALDKNPVVSVTDLVSIQLGYRRWALQRFVERRPEEHLVYHPASSRLELVSARELAHFDSHWRRLLDYLESDPALFGDHARDLIRFLCHNLGFTPGESMGLGPFKGIRVQTHGLRVKLPRQVPVLVSQKPILGPEEVEQLRSLVEQTEQSSRFALLITTGDVQRNVQVLDENLRSLLRYDVIVLSEQGLRDVLRVKNRVAALVGKILEQVDLTVVSPFVTEGPVRASMFFGREGEIKELLYRLERGSVAMLGPRRIGKTSILQRLLSSLRQAGKPVVYLDCQAISNVPELLLSLQGQYLPDKDCSGLSGPAVLSGMLDDLKANYGGRQLYVILDELDLLLQNPDSAPLLRAFRAASREETASFLLCGERTLQVKLHDPDSSLFNFCHEIRIHFLSSRDAVKLITEPFEQMEVRWADAESGPARLVEFTGGHPNLLQRACSGLVERLNEERTRVIEEEMLEEVLYGPLLEDYLETLWGSSTYLEKIVSLQLEEGESLTAQEIRDRLLEAGIEANLPEVMKSLEGLCLFGLLERQGTRHRFSVRSFPVMVRKAMEVEEAIELYKELMAYGS